MPPVPFATSQRAHFHRFALTFCKVEQARGVKDEAFSFPGRFTGCADILFNMGPLTENTLAYIPNESLQMSHTESKRAEVDGGAAVSSTPCRVGESEFGHGYVAAVPRAHPQLLLVGLRPVAGTLQRRPHHQSFVVVILAVHPRLSLATLRHFASVCCGSARHRCLQFGLGRRSLAAAAGAAARAQRNAGLSSPVATVRRLIIVRVSERGGGGGGGGGRGGGSRPQTLEGAQSVAAALGSGAVQRDPLLQRGGQLVQFFKVLGKPGAEDGGRELEVVVADCRVRLRGSDGGGGVGRAPRPHDGAVLGHVHAAVDVGVAVDGGRQAAALALRHAVLSRGAALVLPVHHQLDPTFPVASLKEKTG